MADAVTTHILENGPRFIVVKLTNFSDATGEIGVTKINATSAGPYGVTVGGQVFYPGIHLAITSIWFSVAAMALRLQWHATSNVDIVTLTQSDNWHFLDHRGGFGGLTPPTGVTGITGSIDFTTAGQVANSAYTVILKLTKNVPQA